MSKRYATICDAPLVRAGLKRGETAVVNVTPDGFTGGYLPEGPKGARMWTNNAHGAKDRLYRIRVTPKKD